MRINALLFTLLGICLAAGCDQTEIDRSVRIVHGGSGSDGGPIGGGSLTDASFAGASSGFDAGPNVDRDANMSSLPDGNVSIDGAVPRSTGQLSLVSSDGGIDPVLLTPPTTFDEYCTWGGALFQAWLSSCLQGYEPFEGSNWEALCRRKRLLVERGMMAFHADKAAQCFQEFEAHGCGNYAFLNELDSCRRVLEGLGTDHEPCRWELGDEPVLSFSSQCAGWCGTYEEESSFYLGCIDLNPIGQPCPCERGAYCNDGMCTTRKQEGTQCVPTEVNCLESLVCRGAPGAELCARPLDEHEACLQTTDCGGSLVCHHGHCELAVGAGEECRTMVNCPDGLVCFGRTCANYHEGPDNDLAYCGGDWGCPKDGWCNTYPLVDNDPPLCVTEPRPCEDDRVCLIEQWCDLSKPSADGPGTCSY
jgi:hypothetical protein